MITVERVREILNFDPIAGIFRWKITKRGIKKGKVVGGLGGGTDGLYWQICIDGERYYAHRLAWFYVYGVWPKEVDHIDRNKQNNALANLREATRSQNSKNAKRSRRNLSGFKGVSFQKNRQRWVASIMADGKSTFLGRYATPEQAYEAYCDAAKRLHGEFAGGF